MNHGFGIDNATATLEARAGNIYRFHIGDVLPGDCSSLFLELSSSIATEPCLRIYALHGNNCSSQDGVDGYASQGNVNMSDGSNNNGGDGCNGGGSSGDNDHHDHMGQALSLAGDVVGFSDPIFEDHVFLDVVPTWDSLLHLIGQLTNYNANDPSNSQVSTDLGMVNYQRLPDYARDKDCATDVTNDTRSSRVINVRQTNNDDVSLRWTNQPMQLQSTLLIEGSNYQQLRLILIDASGRQAAILTGTGDQLTVDRQQSDLNRGIYYFLLEGDQEKIGSGVLAVQ